MAYGEISDPAPIRYTFTIQADPSVTGMQLECVTPQTGSFASEAEYDAFVQRVIDALEADSGLNVADPLKHYTAQAVITPTP